MNQALIGSVSSSKTKSWPVLVWCLPSLGGFAGFLASFPIDRQISFWPHLNLAEIFGSWFLFVTPIACAVAIVKLIRHLRERNASRISKSFLLLAITVSVLVNLFVLFGLYAAATF